MLTNYFYDAYMEKFTKLILINSKQLLLVGFLHVLCIASIQQTTFLDRISAS